MRTSNTLVWLSVAIAILAAVAAGTGALYQGAGASFNFTTVRGEVVAIQGHGLYRYEPVTMAAQGMAQDWATLLVGIPLLVISLLLYRRGLVRGQLLLAGTLAYFLYTYASMAFGAAFNPLFLVYVALFSLSVYGFSIAMLSVDVRSLPSHFTDKLPRRGIVVFMFASAAFLLLAWLGRIVPSLVAGTPPAGLLSNTTLFVQALDLGLVVPLAAVSGALLLRRRPLGYLLASVALIKFVTMGIALVAMIIGQWLAGVAMAAAEVVIFPALALAGIVMAFLLLRAVRESAVTGPEPIGTELTQGANQ